MQNNFEEIINHIWTIELTPNLTKGMVRSYCISHNIKYITKVDVWNYKKDIKDKIDTYGIICIAESGKCGVHPIIHHKDEKGNYYITHIVLFEGVKTYKINYFFEGEKK